MDKIGRSPSRTGLTKAKDASRWTGVVADDDGALFLESTLLQLPITI